VLLLLLLLLLMMMMMMGRRWDGWMDGWIVRL